MKKILATITIALLALTMQAQTIDISSASDWTKFANAVKTNPNTNARLTRDVNVGTTTTMIGSDSKPYQGTFDGQGHTLTINLNIKGTGGIGPFKAVKNATIRNLHVAGNISTDQCGAGGIVGYVIKNSNNTFSKCWVSATLSATDTGTAQNTIGGFVCVISGNTTFEDCMFSGKFADKNIRYNGGYAGHCDGGTVTLRNCLNIGTYKQDGGGNYSFIRNASPKISNSYFLNPLGTAQGTQVTTAQLQSGAVAKNLQANRSTSVWVQNSKTNRPVLKIFASGSTTTTPSTTTTTPSNTTQNAPANMTGYRGKNGQTFTFRVTGKTSGRIWGGQNSIYTDDSNIATAAVHAGVVKSGQTATIRIKILADQGSYPSIKRNNITSTKYGAWKGAYQILGGATGGTATTPSTTTTTPNIGPFPKPFINLPASGNLTSIPVPTDGSGVFCCIKVTGRTTGKVFGSRDNLIKGSMFNADSDVATAAVFCGAVKNGETAVIYVLINEAISTDLCCGGIRRHGITSRMKRHKWFQIIQTYTTDGQHLRKPERNGQFTLVDPNIW